MTLRPFTLSWRGTTVLTLPRFHSSIAASPGQAEEVGRFITCNKRASCPGCNSRPGVSSGCIGSNRIRNWGFYTAIKCCSYKVPSRGRFRGHTLNWIQDLQYVGTAKPQCCFEISLFKSMFINVSLMLSFVKQIKRIKERMIWRQTALFCINNTFSDCFSLNADAPQESCKYIDYLVHQAIKNRTL